MKEAPTEQEKERGTTDGEVEWRALDQRTKAGNKHGMSECEEGARHTEIIAMRATQLAGGRHGCVAEYLCHIVSLQMPTLVNPK